MIKVENLKKEFFVKKKPGGARWFTRAKRQTVSAVKCISFDITPGERVAFIGPNGAGKSTTLKMLSGILTPTSGTATVAGFTPWTERKKLAYHIGLVFGQRSQLWYHLPVRESLDLIAKIYNVDEKTYAAQLAELTRIFDLSALLDRPTKTLSLGQRMRCEIAASLVHQPKVLFLDEPTIGLDVAAKAELRDHLRALSQNRGTTIILTSHDTADIEQICDRVILINHGEKLIDTGIDDMRRSYLRTKRLHFTTAEETPGIGALDHAQFKTEKHAVTVEIDPQQVPVAAVISHVMKTSTVQDMQIHDTELEDVIMHIYKNAERSA
jgi:ABC-2 type transport system ATP-binding protein